MFVFFFNNPATTEIYTYGHTLALHDALPILGEHRRSPGIGGEIAADAARALRTERERKQSADALRGLLHVGKHGTAVRHQHVRYRVDVADAVHALQRQDEVVAGTSGNLSADKAGIAGLRDDRGAGLGGKFEDGCDFHRRAGLQHHWRYALVEPAVLDQTRRDILRIAQHMAFSDDRCEAIEKVRPVALLVHVLPPLAVSDRSNGVWGKGV